MWTTSVCRRQLLRLHSHRHHVTTPPLPSSSSSLSAAAATTTATSLVMRRWMSRAVENPPRVNKDIRGVESVRLLDPVAKTSQVVPFAEALKMARSQGLDLIEVVATAKPPVCHVQNVKEYLYKRRKKEKEMQKANAVKKVKEIRVKDAIGDSDFNVKLKKCVEWLSNGHDVKVEVAGVSAVTRLECIERLCGWLVDVGERSSEVEDTATRQIKARGRESLTADEVLNLERRGKARTMMRPRK